jgi:outer membrane lipoprotein-sorting protein
VFSFGPRGQLTDPSEILQALHARSAKLLRLRSEVSVSAEGGRASGSTRGLVAAERPARLRLELDDFFGNPAAVVTSDGALLGVYQASTNVFATGRATPENVGRALPVELPVNEAVDLLFGDPRPLDDEVREFFVDRDRFSYAVVFSVGPGAGVRSQRIDFDSETLLPVAETVEGLEPFRARFSNFEGRSGLHVPRRVEVESLGGRVTLEYRNLEVNPELNKDLFTPVRPPSATAQPLD